MAGGREARSALTGCHRPYIERLNDRSSRPSGDSDACSPGGLGRPGSRDAMARTSVSSRTSWTSTPWSILRPVMVPTGPVRTVSGFPSAGRSLPSHATWVTSRRLSRIEKCTGEPVQALIDGVCTDPGGRVLTVGLLEEPLLHDAGAVQTVAAPWRVTGVSRVKTASRHPIPSVSMKRTVYWIGTLSRSRSRLAGSTDQRDRDQSQSHAHATTSLPSRVRVESVRNARRSCRTGPNRAGSYDRSPGPSIATVGRRPGKLEEKPGCFRDR